MLSVTDSAGSSHAEQESEPSSHRPAISRSATYSLPNQVYTHVQAKHQHTVFSASYFAAMHILSFHSITNHQ